MRAPGSSRSRSSVANRCRRSANSSLGIAYSSGSIRRSSPLFAVILSPTDKLMSQHLVAAEPHDDAAQDAGVVLAPGIEAERRADLRGGTRLVNVPMERQERLILLDDRSDSRAPHRYRVRLAAGGHHGEIAAQLGRQIER